MRVAFDWTPLLDAPTGVGRYTRELAASLELLGTDPERTDDVVCLGGAVCLLDEG